MVLLVQDDEDEEEGSYISSYTASLPPLSPWKIITVGFPDSFGALAESWQSGLLALLLPSSSSFSLSHTQSK